MRCFIVDYENVGDAWKRHVDRDSDAAPPGVNAFVAALASTRLVADTSVSTEKGPVAEGWSSRHAVTRRQSPGSPRHGQAKDAPRATRDAICDATGSEPTPALVHTLALKRDNTSLSKALQALIRDPAR